MESNRFMLECTSICPETTHQKFESQRVYLTPERIDDCGQCCLDVSSLTFIVFLRLQNSTIYSVTTPVYCSPVLCGL